MKTIAPLIALSGLMALGGCSSSGSNNPQQDADIEAIFSKPLYNDSVWALRVVDVETGEVLYDRNSADKLFIGSVRKLFTIGEALDELGTEHIFKTPVYRQGEVNGNGLLEGDLILVASGDFTMGGRRNSDGTMAVTDLDHNEANTLGNAELTAPNPIWGYENLAAQVAASGISAISGDIVIDDRLFQPFEFRGEFNVKPIFINDDVVDVIMRPTNPGELAAVEHRPTSQAFPVTSDLLTVSAGKEEDVQLLPTDPDCFGTKSCFGSVIGDLPVDFIPPLTEAYPYVQVFRIAQPDNYARTVFIEALERAGVAVLNAPPVAQNPVARLPSRNTYTQDALVAELASLPFSEYAKYVLKVSYNIGSDTSLVLWGLSRGTDNMEDALALEREHLIADLDIPGAEFDFVDGSGGGPTTATIMAILKMLEYNTNQSYFSYFLRSLPVLGVDGSLSFFTEFESDPTLAGAKGNAYAKTGTYAVGTDQGILLKGRSMAGFIDTKNGRRLMYSLIVNNVQLGGDIEEMLKVSDDQSTITAILWRDH